MSAAAVEHVHVDIPSVNVGAYRIRLFRFLLWHCAAPGEKLADLGAGPCVFARFARDLGFAVTAVDGRDTRVPSRDELGTIRFVNADVREFDLRGYDVVTILGLLYHLTLDDQRSLLRRAREAPIVIIDTEVHIPELIASTRVPEWQSRIVCEDGFAGVVFPENENPMAAIGNRKSFWHTEDSLIRLFKQSGFDNVKVIDPPYQSKYGGRRFYLLADEQYLRLRRS
jgi:hypothetical protein